MDDYVNLTSFTHHPFYTEFALEVEDNWAWDKAYNIPLNELMRVMESAIDNGYTFVWGADVSEKGFEGCRGGGGALDRHERDDRG